jgi:hypothetical protein
MRGCRAHPFLQISEGRGVVRLVPHHNHTPQLTRPCRGGVSYRSWVLGARPDKSGSGQNFEGLSMEELRAASEGASEVSHPPPPPPHHPLILDHSSTVLGQNSTHLWTISPTPPTFTHSAPTTPLTYTPSSPHKRGGMR